MLGNVQSCLEFFLAGRIYLGILGATRNYSELLGDSRSCSELLGAARSCSELIKSLQPKMTYLQNVAARSEGAQSVT